jgi:acetylornithine deacetylase/succinyl-diaminopimelate desuccinylase-like protein
MDRFGLGHWERRAFERLIEQPSVSIPGGRDTPADLDKMQIAKMQIIEGLLGDSRDQRKMGMTVERWNVREVEGGTEGTKFLYNLVVHKGTRKGARFTVMVPAHIDTVRPDQAWVDAHELTYREASRGNLQGLGVYDMQAAVLNNISLARTLQVPEGMSVYFVFTVNEESSSNGAQTLVDHWPDWNAVDLVLSSEIGSRQYPTDANRLRYITARCGVAKFDGDITLDAGGHAAVDWCRTPLSNYRGLMNRLLRQYASPIADGGLAQEHPLLGKQKLKEWRGMTDSSVGANNASVFHFGHWVRLVPPSTIDSTLTQHTGAFERISEQMRCTERGVRMRLTKNLTRPSYEPFHIPDEHPAVQAVHQGLAAFVGQYAAPGTPLAKLEPRAVGAKEWADENIYAARGKPVISVPYEGGDAHRSTEWVSEASIAQVREALRFLLTNERNQWLAGFAATGKTW